MLALAKRAVGLGSFVLAESASCAPREADSFERSTPFFGLCLCRLTLSFLLPPAASRYVPSTERFELTIHFFPPICAATSF
jgi:hypothetical protein